MSKKEIAGLCVAYAGFGLFFGTFVAFLHPAAPLIAGAGISLLGVWIFAGGRQARWSASRARAKADATAP